MRRNHNNRRGVAAVEFALCSAVAIPIMLSALNCFWLYAQYNRAVSVCSVVVVRLAAGASDSEALAAAEHIAPADATISLSADSVSVSIPARLFLSWVAVAQQPVYRPPTN